MNRTNTRKTVITLLAPNPSAGKRVLQAMSRLSDGTFSSASEFSSPTVLSPPLFRSILPQTHWTSICSHDTRTIFQCLSISPWRISGSAEPPFRIIGIQEKKAVEEEAILRMELVEHIFKRMNGLQLALMLLSRRFPSPLQPLLDVAQDAPRDPPLAPIFHDGDIKEVVFHESVPPSLPQLVTGVYTTPRGLRIRPLPPAVQDHRTSAPTVVFHQSLLPDDDRFIRIGFTGRNLGGQLLLKHPDALGLRLCQAQVPQSMFAEAQDSLLASSLGDLQSKRVLDGGKEDPRTNQSDCWVEFRAQVASPAGYLKKGPTRS